MAEIKTGYVHKCGNTVKSWKRRWFVLKANGYLYYYEDKNSTLKQEKGKIDVVDASKIGEWKEIATVHRKLPSGFSSSNAFGIVVGDRTFTCVCENEGEHQSWIDAINRVRNPDNQEYPEPTYPKEKPEPQAPPIPVKTQAPLSSAPPVAPPAYGGSLPRHSHISPPPPEVPVMSQTLPRPKPRPVSQPAPPQPAPMPALPATNPYYTPEVKQQIAGGGAQAPPPYQAPPPQAPPPQPQYRPPPPQPQYSPQQQYRAPPPQQQYRAPPPQPQYGAPPPQHQYRPPPPQQPYYGPPRPQYRPPPPQQQPYCPPGTQAYAPPVRGPYQSQPQRPPPVQYRPPVQYGPPPPAVRTVQKTTVTVVNVGAQQIVYR